jgi:hypothetical protein
MMSVNFAADGTVVWGVVDNCVSAGSPIDFVSVAVLVMVPKSVISGDEFTRIDFWVDYEVVRAADFVGRSRLCRPKSEGNRGDRASG